MHGEGALKKFREELEVEDEGFRIPSNIRWLGGKENILARRSVKGIAASSVAFVVGEATYARLCKVGLWLLGRCYEVEHFEEERPDSFCSRCCAWGHIGPRCMAAVPRRAPARRSTPQRTTDSRSRGVR